MSTRVERDFGSTDVVETSVLDLTGAGYSAVALVAGDVKISKDGAGFVNVANLPTNNGGQLRWTPAANELNAKTITLRIADQDTPPEFLLRELIIETRAHASAMHPNLGLTLTTIANAINAAALAIIKTLKRTGTHGNGGFTVTGPAGAVTGTLATDADAAPITAWDTDS